MVTAVKLVHQDRDTLLNSIGFAGVGQAEALPLMIPGLVQSDEKLVARQNYESTLFQAPVEFSAING